MQSRPSAVPAGRTPQTTMAFVTASVPCAAARSPITAASGGSQAIRWVDIAAEPEWLRAHGLDHRSAVARFHVRGRDGAWHRGAWGFAEPWSQLTAYRWLGRSLHLLLWLDRAYVGFARWRLHRSCAKGGCSGADH